MTSDLYAGGYLLHNHAESGGSLANVAMQILYNYLLSNTTLSLSDNLEIRLCVVGMKHLAHLEKRRTKKKADKGTAIG